jgi:hypothetical protein
LKKLGESRERYGAIEITLCYEDIYVDQRILLKGIFDKLTGGLEVWQ